MKLRNTTLLKTSLLGSAFLTIFQLINSVPKESERLSTAKVFKPEQASNYDTLLSQRYLTDFKPIIPHPGTTKRRVRHGVKLSHNPKTAYLQHRQGEEKAKSNGVGTSSQCGGRPLTT